MNPLPFPVSSDGMLFMSAISWEKTMVKHDELLKSAEELCRKAELHRQLMCGEYDALDSYPAHCLNQQAIIRLRQAICESITVIEDTRSAFKSKRLEGLRKKLIQVLAEVQ